jgi:hypothetical protein
MPILLLNALQVSEIEIMVVLRGGQHHIQQRSYTFRINRYRIMTLTYRGVKYKQEDQAQKDKAWWNLAHRPWLCLTYRNVCYFPFVTGGQIK